MHNVADYIRARYPDADFLIASVKPLRQKIENL